MIVRGFDIKPIVSSIIILIIGYIFAFVGNVSTLGNSTTNNKEDIKRLEVMINEKNAAVEKRVSDDKKEIEERVLQVYQENRQDHRDISLEIKDIKDLLIKKLK